MPLLVMALGPEELGLLTLREWDALLGCERVLFERADHPLMERLAAAGIEVALLGDPKPDPGRSGWGLVVEPGLARTVELARAGARISAGSAETPDDLTAAYGAPIVRRAAAALGSLVAVMARLRGPEGCPWDREQDHRSLEIHLIEEAHEVLEAIDEGLLGAELEEELGDVLLQVAFHAQMAADDGRFDMAGVAEAITAKLIHRHPHVFGDTPVAGAGEVLANWESLKAEERKIAGVAGGPWDGIPAGLPALLAAYKTQKRAAGLGWSPTAEDARKHLEQALADPDGSTIGEALFWQVALARSHHIDPEGALRRATSDFRSSWPQLEAGE